MGSCAGIRSSRWPAGCCAGGRRRRAPWSGRHHAPVAHQRERHRHRQVDEFGAGVGSVGGAKRDGPHGTDHAVIRVRSDRGSMVMETVLLTPAMMAFVALIVFGARLSLAQQAVQVAANDAARSASIERTQGAAVASGSRSASATLSTQGLECRSVDVDVDASGFNTSLGQSATATASSVRVSTSATTGTAPVSATSSAWTAT